jgi:hypothetical protein
MALGFLAMTLVYAWLLVHRVRVARLEDAHDDAALAAAIDERRREAVPMATVTSGGDGV